MCPDRDILSAYFDGEVPSPWREAIAGHAASCASCAAELARLERARQELQSEGGPDWRGPMERVRRGILAYAAARPRRLPLWRRTLTVPVPLAAAAAALVVAVGTALIGVSLRAPVGHVRITRVPAGATEIQISAPAGDLEALLRSVGGEEGPQEEVITLPKNVILFPVGEPRMGKAAEFPRKKTW
jgi:anti-sigma factor RsiW